MMNEFSTIRTQYGPALCIVDTSRYDGFIGFNRIVKYLSDIELGKFVCYVSFKGKASPYLSSHKVATGWRKVIECGDYCQYKLTGVCITAFVTVEY